MGPVVISALVMNHSGISNSTRVTLDTFPAGRSARWDGFAYSRLSSRTRITRSGILERRTLRR